MEFENEKLNEAYKSNNLRGFMLNISDVMLSDILATAMGLEGGTIQITHIEYGIHFRGFRISAISHDERFPELKLGEMYPLISPKLKRVPIVDDGETIGYKTEFDGFEVQS